MVKSACGAPSTAADDDEGRERPRLSSLGGDPADRAREGDEGGAVLGEARPLERDRDERSDVGDEVAGGRDHGGAVVLRCSRDVHRDAEGRIDRDRDHQTALLRNDPVKRNDPVEAPEHVRGYDGLDGGGDAARRGDPQPVVRSARPDPDSAHARRSRDLGHRRAEQCLRLADANERAHGARTAYRRVGGLPSQRPGDLGDDETDRDERLHRPEIRRARFTGTDRERGVESDDRESGHPDRADRSEAKRGRADGEDVERPWREREGERVHERGDRDEIDRGASEWHARRETRVPKQDSGAQVEEERDGGEG